jgi:hypothetical protein
MKNVFALCYALLVFVLTLVFGGCGAAPDPRGLPDGARFEYDPSPDTAPLFAAAAERIEKATGVVLVDVPGGTPIDLSPADEINGDCGWTPVTFHQDPVVVVDVYILIASDMPRGCQDAETVLVHELIHSLRRGLDIGQDEHGHSETGLFSAFGGDGRLDAGSLTQICDAVPCTRFEAE